ncbi:MAG TPA: Gfo/Idh/MocA family oxidoreductase, partial [Friedmanniella sp.]
MNSTPTTPLLLPVPRTADPRDAPSLRWGVLAPGWIAGQTISAVRAHTGQRVVAVGSRSLERSQEFAATHGVDRAYGSYAELVADPEVDAVYVASPHSQHHEQALLAIAAGKHVLVEKPFTRNAAEAREVMAAAQAAGVLAMEAMWSRYLPHTDVVRQLLDDGALGDVRLVTADFSIRTDPEPSHRMLNPALAGGALLDLGVYPLSFAALVARHAGLARTPGDVRPDAVHAAGVLAATGVDAQSVVLLDWTGRAQAQVTTSILGQAGRTATVVGSDARVELGAEFFVPASVTLVRGEERAVWATHPIRGHEGLCYQIAAFAGYVADGRTESPLQSADEV